MRFFNTLWTDAGEVTRLPASY